MHEGEEMDSKGRGSFEYGVERMVRLKGHVI